jgi:hypothetical protein
MQRGIASFYADVYLTITEIQISGNLNQQLNITNKNEFI